MAGTRFSVRLPNRMVPICVRDPIGFAKPCLIASTPAKKVEVIAPIPGITTPNFPCGGAICIPLAIIIKFLYEASSAGVKIRLIIRGMLSLVPGIKKVSDNIKAIGIVDRYLEHSRFMIFCNDGNEQVYITSADLMPRNLDHRIEVTCPVFDKNIKLELRKIFDIQWEDNVKARIFNESQSNEFVKSDGKSIQSQIEVYNYLKKINEKAL